MNAEFDKVAPVLEKLCHDEGESSNKEGADWKEHFAPDGSSYTLLRYCWPQMSEGPVSDVTTEEDAVL